MDDHTARESLADSAAVDAVLTASRSMVAVAMRSLGAAAEETAIAQYRALVLVSVTPAGRHVVDEATARRRAVIADILGRLSVLEQQAVAEALRVFADAAGSRWPVAAAARKALAPGPRRPVQSGGPSQPVPPACDNWKELR
jgi:hypothetical protein